jgi:hypothetical protein
MLVDTYCQDIREMYQNISVAHSLCQSLGLARECKTSGDDGINTNKIFRQTIKRQN